MVRNLYFIELYLSDKFSMEISGVAQASDEEMGWSLDVSSVTGGLYMNEVKSGSGSVWEEGNKNEDPPRWDCRVPSLSSLLKLENEKLEDPLRNLLLRWT